MRRRAYREPTPVVLFSPKLRRDQPTHIAPVDVATDERLTLSAGTVFYRQRRPHPPSRAVGTRAAGRRPVPAVGGTWSTSEVCEPPLRPMRRLVTYWVTSEHPLDSFSMGVRFLEAASARSELRRVARDRVTA
jgi:hypothetical protein